MVSESSIWCEGKDDTFGPHADGCRGGFDFTLMFEETVLTIIPLAFILICAPFRTLYLLRKRTKVHRSWLLIVKLVCISGFVINIWGLTD